MRELRLEGIALWTLAAVFVLAGYAKIRRPQFAAVALADFGVIRSPRPWHGLALGYAEIALAVTIATSPRPAMALAAAGMVLWVFAAALARRLQTGNTAPCFCFGDAEEPISRKSVIRTGTLALLATLAATLAPHTRVLDAAVIALQVLSAAALIAGILLISAFRRLTAPPLLSTAEVLP